MSYYPHGGVPAGVGRAERISVTAGNPSRFQEVPAGQVWRALCVHCIFKSNAEASPRSLVCGVNKEPFGPTLWVMAAPTLIKPSEEWTVNFFFSANGGTASTYTTNFAEVSGGQKGFQGACFPETIMLPKDFLYLECVAEKAGDQFLAPCLTYERLQ